MLFRSLKKKKKKRSDIFGFTCAKPHLTPLPTSQSLYLFIPLASSLLHFSFLSSSSFLFSVEHSLLSSSPPALPHHHHHHHHHHFYHHFSGKITRKFLRTHKHLHIPFFLGKNSSSFWWVLHFYLRLFLSKF